VLAEPGRLHGSQPIEFVVSPFAEGEDHFTVVEKSRFIVP